MRRFRPLAVIVIVLMSALCGCQKLKDIKVTSVKVESLQMKGFRGADIVLAVGVDNPSVKVSVSEIEGSLKHSGKVIGRLAMSPFILKARTKDVYRLEAELSIAEGVGLKELMVLANPSSLNECTVDISAKAKAGGSGRRPVEVKNIPLKELLEQVSNEKI